MPSRSHNLYTSRQHAPTPQEMAAAETFVHYSVATAICCFHMFGPGFMFLTNAFYHASECAGFSGATMLGVVLGGAAGAVAAVFVLLHLVFGVTKGNPVARMMATGLFHATYCTLAVHLVLSSLDAQFAVMAALVLAGFLMSVRYDVSDALIVWMLSALFGASVLVVEHLDSTRHTRNAQMHCLGDEMQLWGASPSTLATANLVAGGVWVGLPYAISVFFVMQLPDFSSRDAWPQLPIYGLYALAVLLPVGFQAFNPLDAWAPMLITGTHMHILEDIAQRPFTIFIIVSQAILLLGATAPSLWLMLLEVHVQAKKMRATDANMWMVTVTCVCLWAVFLLYVPFAALGWIYLGLAAMVLASGPVALLWGDGPQQQQHSGDTQKSS